MGLLCIIFLVILFAFIEKTDNKDDEPISKEWLDQVNAGCSLDLFDDNPDK